MNYKKRLEIATIISDIEEYYNLAPGAMLEKNRLKTVAKARKLAMYLARRHTDHSLEEIADAFHRTHSTIVKQIRDMKGLEQEVVVFNDIYRFVRGC